MLLPEKIGHWPLRGNPDDLVAGRHGIPRNLSFTEGPDGAPRGAMLGNGQDSFIEVPDAAALRLGNRDFSCSIWVKPQAPIRGVFGDVLSKFDDNVRCGFNLQIAGSAPAYCGMSDSRHVHFGIDDGYTSDWEDCGKPWPGNPLVSCLVAHAGRLYAGIAHADNPMEAAHVFCYEGRDQWTDCGRLGNDPRSLSVQAMVVHNGALYAGTGVWESRKCRGLEPGFTCARTHVFRYEGGTSWTDCGQVGEGTRIISMGSFQGELYVGLDNWTGGGKCHKYDGKRWTDCGAPDGRFFESFQPLGGRLYAATHGNLYQYAGKSSWTCLGLCPHQITQIHCLQVYRGRMYAGTWPQGYVLAALGRDDDWSIVGRLGLPPGLKECNEVMALAVYNGKLYAGVIPKAQVYRYEGNGHWTLLASLASRPEWAEEAAAAWCRVTCLTPFQGGLFAATGACMSTTTPGIPFVDPDGTLGRVYRLQAGQGVSHDREIGNAWTHLAAVRQGKELRLYVNGELSAASTAPRGHTFDLTNTRPLFIGYGAQGHFDGALADLRLYAGALQADQVKQISAARGKDSGADAG